jgi:hypothetical protein
MKKLSRIISSNAIVWPSGERQKNAVPTSHPVPARSVSRVEVSPPHSAPDSAIVSHVPGPCVTSSDPVVRNGHPAFAGCLRAGRYRLLGTASLVHHIRAPLSRGKAGRFWASVAVVRSPVRGARCAEETVVPDRSLVHRAPSSATRSIGRDGRLLPGACGHEPLRKVRIYASTAWRSGSDSRLSG